MKTLQDRVAVVTGAAGGIGKALVRELARVGMHVVLAGRDMATMDALAEEVRALGRRSSVVRTDVRYLEQLENLLDQTLKEHGGEGLIFLWGFEFDEEEKKWVDGHILNPDDGNVYNSTLTLTKSGTTLEVYGFIQVLVKIGGTRHWVRPTLDEMKDLP